MMKAVRLSMGCVAVVGAMAGSVQAVPVAIDFENFAPAGGLVNINPGVPYSEDGFTITPTDASSAVFDSAAGSLMIGNPSDWFGFAETNKPTLTLTAGSGPFNLIDALIGPSTIAGAAPISITITGHIFGGGTVNATFPNLSTATLANINFNNLQSVDFTTTDDGALDNIRVEAVPEPSSLALCGVGACLGVIVGARRRRRDGQ